MGLCGFKRSKKPFLTFLDLGFHMLAQFSAVRGKLYVFDPPVFGIGIPFKQPFLL